MSFLKLQKLRAEKARERAEIEREREQGKLCALILVIFPSTYALKLVMLEKERKRRLAEERARLREEKSREEEVLTFRHRVLCAKLQSFVSFMDMLTSV